MKSAKSKTKDMTTTVNSNDHRYWQAILSDPAAPADLKAQARAKLGASAHSPVVETPGGYDASLDPIVESYWHSRQSESELRDPVAERTYHSLVYLLALGGGPDAVEQARWLLTVFPACKSAWMRARVARALRVAYTWHRDVLPATLADELMVALNPPEAR